jgi:beta-lactamase regulating signal transducer with metallopeptidase domain
MNFDYGKTNIGFSFLLLNMILLSICILYFMFCLFFGKRLILKSINAKICSDPGVLNTVEKLCEEIKIIPPKVYVFDGDPNAFIFGYPVSIVISNNLIKYLSKKELDIAIRHELAHITNKDHILKPLLQTIRILFFYNPIIHLLYKKMINERELMADSKFITNKREKIKFMEILFKIDNLRKNKNIFSKQLYELTSLSLISHKVKKLEITDKFNNLFSNNRKKSFISILICFLVLLSSISILPIYHNNFLDNSINYIYEFNKDRPNSNINGKTDDNDTMLDSNTVYILRLIQKNSDQLDIVLIEEKF